MMQKSFSEQLRTIHAMNLSAYVNLQKTVENVYKMLFIKESEQAAFNGNYADYDCFHIEQSNVSALIDYFGLDRRKNAAFHFVMIHTTMEHAVALSVNQNGFIVDRKHLYGQDTIDGILKTFLPSFNAWHEPVWKVQGLMADNTMENVGGNANAV